MTKNTKLLIKIDDIAYFIIFLLMIDFSFIKKLLVDMMLSFALEISNCVLFSIFRYDAVLVIQISVHFDYCCFHMNIVSFRSVYFFLQFDNLQKETNLILKSLKCVAETY